MFNIIIAIDEKYGIGQNNKLPWKCKSDLKHFKETTLGQILIVGRKTWESMPQKNILRNRNVIVVSNTLQNNIGVHISHSLQEALNTAYQFKFKDQNVFVIGGVKLYEEAISHNDLECIHLTNVYGTYDCDTFALFLKKTLESFSLFESKEHNECKTARYIRQPSA
tara:strand:+ start:10837 stop:11334 length:498 start_codon:yes stop_codon:yes gene_type:complete